MSKSEYEMHKLNVGKKGTGKIGAGKKGTSEKLGKKGTLQNLRHNL